MTIERAGSEQGILRLIRLGDPDSDPDHVGLGMLVDPCTVLTCAHVVNLCLGRGTYQTERPPPAATIRVSFPILGDGEMIEAEIVDWAPPGRAGIDCAVLRLHDPAPRRAGLAILSVIDGDTILGDPLSVYGSPKLGDPGRHLSASLSGAVGARLIQMDVDGAGDVEPGFSGGAVWNTSQRAAVGMLVARRRDRGGATAYFLPAERVVERFPEAFPVEIRRIPLRRQRWFTIVASLLFVLMLAHFLDNRQRDGLALPWTQGDPRLAAFFGLHCFAVILGPLCYVECPLPRPVLRA